MSQELALMSNPSPVPGSLHLSQGAWICASDFSGADLSSPIWADTILLGVKFPLSLDWCRSSPKFVLDAALVCQPAYFSRSKGLR